MVLPLVALSTMRRVALGQPVSRIHATPRFAADREDVFESDINVQEKRLTMITEKAIASLPQQVITRLKQICPTFMVTLRVPDYEAYQAKGRAYHLSGRYQRENPREFANWMKDNWVRDPQSAIEQLAAGKHWPKVFHDHSNLHAFFNDVDGNVYFNLKAMEKDDAQLVKMVVHELGHAVDYHLGGHTIGVPFFQDKGFKVVYLKEVQELLSSGKYKEMLEPIPYSNYLFPHGDWNDVTLAEPWTELLGALGQGSLTPVEIVHKALPLSLAYIKKQVGL